MFDFPDEPEIHLRSASRKGYSDFGVKRRRVERIRKLFHTRLYRKVEGQPELSSTGDMTEALRSMPPPLMKARWRY